MKTISFKGISTGTHSILVFILLMAGTMGQARALGPQPEPPDMFCVSKTEVLNNSGVVEAIRGGTFKNTQDSVIRMGDRSDALRMEVANDATAALHASSTSLLDALAGERRPFDEVVMERLSVDFDHAKQAISLGGPVEMVSETGGVASPTYKARCMLWNRSIGKSARMSMKIGEDPLGFFVGSGIVEPGDVGIIEYELDYEQQACISCQASATSPGPVWVPEEGAWGFDESTLFIGWNDYAPEFAVESRLMEIGFEGDRFVEIVEEAVRAQPLYGQEIFVPGHGSGVVEMEAGTRLERGSEPEAVDVNDETAILVYPPQVIVPFSVGSFLNVEAVFSLRMNTEDTFVIDLLELRPDPTGIITALVRTFIQEVPIPLPADSVLSNFGDMPDVIGRGVTISEEGWLTIRFEYARCNPDDLVDGFAGNDAGMQRLMEEAEQHCLSASRPAWRGFFLGSVRPHVGGADWNVYVDEQLLQQVFETTLRDSLEAIPDVAISGRFGSELHPLGDDGINIDFWMSGDYLVPYCSMAFSADVDINLYLDGDALAIHGAMPAVDAHPGVHCSSLVDSIANLLLPGFSWAINVGINELIDVLIRGYEDEFNISGSLEDAGMDCTQSGSEFTCRTPIPLSPIVLSDTSSAIFSVDHLVGGDSGLLLGGSMDIFRIHSMHPSWEYIFDFLSDAD